jgi:cytoskeletal protein CcmA (bactofilin family)
MAADKETIIGAETRISGEIRGEEDLVVKGRIEGRIHLSQSLTVEKGAIVQADVDVRTLVVSGTLAGNIVASESVRLLPSARVVGDLAAPRVAMESGAAYRGRVDMGDVEAARAAVTSHAVAKSAVGVAARDRPAPPRMAPPPRTVAVAPKTAPKAPAERQVASEATPASPPAFPRVAGVVGSAAPAWAKKKIRRR